ncbi:uncharacterized protein TNCV_79821 [Trichonephila clavipes]|nr:uncharacterized protein TNCV_79821 [Trichonephila clavipes]
MASIEQWYSSRSTAPESLTVKRALHGPFTGWTGTIIQLGVAFSQRSSSPRLIEEENFNDSDIVNNLIDYEDGQEEPDSLRVDKNMQRSSFPTNWKSIFLKYIPIKKGV